MQLVYPVLFTLFVWWFSTGAILYLDGLPRRTFRWSFAAASGVLVAALYGIAATRGNATLLGAYVAFGCSILVWGWQEIGFLMGFVTGPRRAPCPPGATGWSRFVYATQTIIHHELAIAALGVAIIALTFGARNQTATGTFVILWVMRLSSKLNLFLGVRNLYEDFLPDHLRYLKTYFRRKAMNPLFPLSIVVSTLVAVLLWQRALAPDTATFDATQATFLATIMTLAVVEHWFLVMPLPATALWRWGLRSRENGAAPVEPPHIKAALR
jgi:putative photosynthetic complex assembly protein 2